MQINKKVINIKLYDIRNQSNTNDFFEYTILKYIQKKEGCTLNTLFMRYTKEVCESNDKVIYLRHQFIDTYVDNIIK